MSEMTHGVTIRPAETTDGSQIRKLAHQVLREHGFTPDPDGMDADIEAVVPSYVEAGGAFDVMVGIDGGLVGTVGIMPHQDGVCELRKMYLRPSHRGRGLGRHLLVHALGRARALGFKRMELQTDAVFDRAITLYRRFGFEPAGNTPDNSPCDRMLVLDLSESTLEI